MFWPRFIAGYLIVIGMTLTVVIGIVASKTKPTLTKENAEQNHEGS